MAKLQAHVGIDMTNPSQTIGRVAFHDEDTLVVRVGRADTYYFGDFSYPGGEWKGTIQGVSYYHRGAEWWSVRGIELDTRFATAGANVQTAYRKAFSGNDRMFGSDRDDRLVGYSGDDRVVGGGGDDGLRGSGGDDALIGSRGRDVIRGQHGRDRLEGGRGHDRLSGGEGGDTFVFGASDGADRILDFRNRADKIAIEEGARRFDQLAIADSGDGVTVSFGRTVIEIEDVALRTIGAEDFIF